MNAAFTRDYAEYNALTHGPGGLNGPSVSVSPTATTYTITGTDGNGCTGATHVSVVVYTINADAGPDKTICSGGTTTLNASGGTIFTWTPATGLNNASISNPIASPSVTTTYTVTVANNVGCTASASESVKVTVSCTGIDDHINSNGIVKVFPNPFSDNATFTIQSNKANEEYSFELYNVLGKQVRSLNEINSKPFQISHDDLPNGIYVYKIYSSESIIGIGKVVIE